MVTATAEPPALTARDIICAYDWPCDEALAIAACESRLQADAVSPDGQNFGYFQINAVHAWRVGGDLSSLLDPVVNTRIAYEIWREKGWQPWSCKA